MQSFSSFLKSRSFRIEGNVLIPLKNLGLPRSQMPQILSTDVPDYLSWLKKEFGYNNRIVSVKVTDLIPTQNEVNLDKCKAMAESGKADSKMSLTSGDMYVLDGHHRVFAHLFTDPNKTFKVIQIQAPILDILKATFHYPKVSYKNINESTELDSM